MYNMLVNLPCLCFRDQETEIRALTGFPVADQLATRPGLEPVPVQASSCLLLQHGHKIKHNRPGKPRSDTPFSMGVLWRQSLSWNGGWVLRPTVGLHQWALSPVCLSFPTYKLGMIELCELA